MSKLQRAVTDRACSAVFCRFQACRFYGILVVVIVENDNRFHLSPAAASAKRLSEIPLNQRCRIARLEGPGEDCDRLMDLGFTPGEEVIVTHTAPLGDPIVIRVRGALLALRKREAAWIFIE